MGRIPAAGTGCGYLSFALRRSKEEGGVVFGADQTPGVEEKSDPRGAGYSTGVKSS
jgi:tRNA A58 N-methylase Trm61